MQKDNASDVPNLTFAQKLAKRLNLRAVFPKAFELVQEASLLLDKPRKEAVTQVHQTQEDVNDGE